MLKHLCLAIITLNLNSSLAAQSPEWIAQPDTLLVEHFFTDPAEAMLAFPSGTDQAWVNFDEDAQPNLCGEDFTTVASGWFYEVDFNDTTNSVFVSCSFVSNDIVASTPNRNWLILPPIVVENSTTKLTWRSTPFQGPSFLDGYQVLVSTNGNNVLESVFTDTLFTAAEMLFCDGAACASTQLSSFQFSDGYIHANGFTDSTLFEYESQIKANICFLEPHEVSLADYVGSTIYIAFLHDSNNDFLLQIDDIAVVQSPVSTYTASSDISALSVVPNPTSDQIQLNFHLNNSENIRIELRDIRGQLIKEMQQPATAGQHRVPFDTALLPTGTYYIAVHTPTDFQVAKLLKY
jgi:Secretion system C-terminal sorting domain/Cleaved Adhesin Domain